MTFFVYLNTLPDDAGGSTSFPELGLSVRPNVGDAIFWMNMDFDGNYYEQTLHGGDMVTGDVRKWGINIWIRENSY
jgi:prolyl 4-hydroxylase